MILPVGVWNVFGSFAYYVATGGTMSYEQYSISANSVVVADNNLLTIGRYTTETGRYMVNRMNTIYVSNGTQPVYLTFKLIFSGGGSYQYNNTTQTTYVNFYAVRIA